MYGRCTCTYIYTYMSAEFSLIIASIAVGMGIFTDAMYLTIVIGNVKRDLSIWQKRPI